MRTYKQAHFDLMSHLATEGWTVRTLDRNGRALKVPHATSGDFRLWFKARAVLFSFGQAELGNARSLHLDARALTPAQFLAELRAKGLC